LLKGTIKLEPSAVTKHTPNKRRPIRSRSVTANASHPAKPGQRAGGLMNRLFYTSTASTSFFHLRIADLAEVITIIKQ
jgi:hypothetical protein